jgi:hypothetical protein
LLPHAQERTTPEAIHSRQASVWIPSRKGTVPTPSFEDVNYSISRLVNKKALTTPTELKHAPEKKSLARDVAQQMSRASRMEIMVLNIPRKLTRR